MAGSSQKEAGESERAAPRRGRRRLRASSARVRASRRWLVAASVVAVLGVLAVWTLWIAIHRVRWLGPWLADTGRVLIGSRAVSRLENLAYDADDLWNRFWRRGETPIAHWTIPEAPKKPGSDLAPDGEDARMLGGAPLFLPKDVGPFTSEVAAKGDGVWLPLADYGEGNLPVVIFKTLLHPDKERPWAEVFVVAIDLRRTRLRAVAGSIEPEASTEEGQRYLRKGLIPEEHQPSLVVAFNGGFKAEHGQYGMKVDGVTLLPPRNSGCTVAGYSDGQVRIATWTSIAAQANDMTWFRQTPACMVESGDLHAALKSDRATSWGTAIEGGTVVRRSAIGLDETGDVLYASVSNATNARAMARAMRHAGATRVAQLDINWSYPHIVTFRRSKSGAPEGALLFDGFTYEDGTYLARRSRRDFFYVTREANIPSRSDDHAADESAEH
jgi:hypothetical protein